MFRKVIAITAGVLAVLAVGVGCGGDDDSGSSLTKAEFTKQADAICKKQEEKKNNALTTAYEKLGKEGKEGKKAQEEVIADVALPPISQMTEELADLGAPEGEEEKAEEMVAAFEEEVQKIEDDLPGTLSGKVGNFDKANKLAKEMGLKDCSLI